MDKIYIEYLINCFNDTDLEEIKQIFKDAGIETIFHENFPCVNAALDDLVATVLLAINSNELQSMISILNLVNAIVLVVKYMRNKFKGKTVSKISSDKVEKIPPNIIIQVGNTKILLPLNITDDKFKKYVHTALIEAKQINESALNRNTVIIEENNDTINIYSLEEFAKRKINMNYKTLRVIPMSNKRRNSKSRR